jgi:hypothetical protein
MPVTECSIILMLVDRPRGLPPQRTLLLTHSLKDWRLSQRVSTLSSSKLVLWCCNAHSNLPLSIVAVHGLNGHRDKTWTAANGIHWLRDLLPKDIPNARILCWGYDANTHSKSRVSCQYIYDHARALVSDLYLERKLSNV